MIISKWCYHSRGLDCSRPILLLLLLAGWSLPAGLRRCCCRVNVTLFSRVTLIRKPQSASDLDHFHARALPCSRVKSRDDPTSGVEEIAEFPIPLYIEIPGDMKLIVSTEKHTHGLHKVGCFQLAMVRTPVVWAKVAPGLVGLVMSLSIKRRHIQSLCVAGKHISSSVR